MHVTPTLDARFRKLVAVEHDGDGFRLAVAPDGTPVALDPFAAAVLDCFTEWATIDEIATDLEEAVALDRPTAVDSVLRVVGTLVGSGHLEVEGQSPPSRTGPLYPPLASP